jgi:ABC-type arginine transport system permease subunit
MPRLWIRPSLGKVDCIDQGSWEEAAAIGMSSGSFCRCIRQGANCAAHVVASLIIPPLWRIGQVFLRITATAWQLLYVAANSKGLRNA